MEGKYKIKYIKVIFFQLMIIITMKLTVTISFLEKFIFYSKSSYIMIKVNKTGNIRILNDITTLPDEIYINGENQSQIQFTYEIDSFNTNIKLVWNNPLEETYNMFGDCSNITEIDLSNFDTSENDHMRSMFSGCSSLVSLDMSNTDTTAVNAASDIFSGCSNLEYIFVDNTIISSVFYAEFKEILPDKLMICGNNRYIKSNLDVCDIFINCVNENNGIIRYQCYKECSENEFQNKNPCRRCGNNYYKILNNEKDNNTYIYCYESPEGFYLEDSLYLECYPSCKSCERGGDETNHNCLECNDNYRFQTNMSIYLNCYNNCSFYLYNDTSTNKAYCTQSFNCPEKYNKLIINKSECIDDCSKDDIFKYEFNNICYDNNQSLFFTEAITKEITQLNFISSIIESEVIKTTQLNYISTKIESEEINQLSYVNNMIESDSFNVINIPEYVKNKSEDEKIIEYILNNSNKSDIVKGNDFFVQYQNISLSLTTNINQEKNLNKNRTTIDITQLEEKIKLDNNIPLNESLFIVLIIKEEQGMKIPQVEYEIYYPFNNNKLEQLDLSKYKNEEIFVSNPINIDDDNLDKYNSSSGYYNNICYKTTSKKGTDLSLFDRKKIFVEENMTLCEEDCELIDYNYTIKKAKCSCLIKINIPLFKEIKFDKNKLYKRFTDFNNITSIEYIKCYRDIFKTKSLIKNIGFYIYLMILIFFIICFFLFYCKYYSEHMNLIKKIADSKIGTLAKKKIIKKSNKITNINENSAIKRKGRIKKSVKKYKENKDSQKIKPKKNKKGIINSISFPPLKNKVKKRKTKTKEFSFSTKNEINNKINKASKNDKLETLNNSNNNKNKIINNELLEYNDSEMNSLDYEKAIINDKRTYIQYYLSLLRKNHLVVFSFYPNSNDYNVQIIKTFLFFFSFSVHLFVNALFFNDNTIHEIYEDEGHFNFIYQIPQIMYSSLISVVINIIVKFLSLTEKKILEIKSENSLIELNLKSQKIYKILKLKFGLFFIITFLLLLTFTFLVSCFCGILINTQLHLIKDTIISFGLSFIYPFFIYLIPGIFRILSLRAQKKDRKCVYKFSQLIQNL